MRGVVNTIVLAFFLGLMLVVAFSLHPFGEPPAVMDNYIIQHTQEQTGANNAVTAVVFDYRGFDTLGEATILFTTVSGVVMLFRRKKRDGA